MGIFSKIIIGIGSVIIILIIVIMGASSVEQLKVCKQKDIGGFLSCSQERIDCHDNCDKLNMGYFRMEKAGWGSYNCWCINNYDETVQVW